MFLPLFQVWPVKKEATLWCTTNAFTGLPAQHALNITKTFLASIAGFCWPAGYEGSAHLAHACYLSASEITLWPGFMVVDPATAVYFLTLHLCVLMSTSSTGHLPVHSLPSPLFVATPMSQMLTVSANHGTGRTHCMFTAFVFHSQMESV